MSRVVYDRYTKVSENGVSHQSTARHVVKRNWSVEDLQAYLTRCKKTGMRLEMTKHGASIWYDPVSYGEGMVVEAIDVIYLSDV